MNRKLAVVVVLAAALPAATALAAKSPFKPTGYFWNGKTNDGNAVRFSTNLKERRITGFNTVANNVQCSFNGQTEAPTPLPLGASKAIAVKGGSFSNTQSSGGTTAFGSITLKLVGHLSGKNASGTVTWTLSGSSQISCMPSSGTITFSAKRGAKQFPGGSG